MSTLSPVTGYVVKLGEQVLLFHGKADVIDFGFAHYWGLRDAQRRQGWLLAGMRSFATA